MFNTNQRYFCKSVAKTPAHTYSRIHQNHDCLGFKEDFLREVIFEPAFQNMGILVVTGESGLSLERNRWGKK